MALGSRLSALVAVAVVVFATTAHAAPGEYRLISGTLVWPQVLMSERLVVVLGDDGVTYFTELASPEGLPKIKSGDRVTVVGREGTQPGQITSASVAPTPRGLPATSDVPYPSAMPGNGSATPPSAMLPPGVVLLDPSVEAILGTVEVVNGNTLTVATPDRWVSVDISRIDHDVVAGLVRGEFVRVLAQMTEGRLVAQGVIVEHGVAAATPR
jgi:hypothetical protein